ncbi:anthranilate synthase component II [Bacillus andreraoultii]|uniref:anthranilate synthase component II n=1 Tax=Bacillus andreraoultii TaxID=1499685 RepID=UPI00053A6A6B|nr:aminodeoxychorismate/anthranilate synthase component II [Bacillus andreraoultii]
MYLLIDNYDSFTYNIFQYFSEAGVKVQVARNDEISILDIEKLQPEGIIISPGPGTPEDAGICIEVIQQFYQTTPILGICLGHQAIAVAFGGALLQAEKIMHGKTSIITHNGCGIVKNIPEQVTAMRYHSLVINKNELPEDLEIVANSIDDKEIMAIKHKDYPLYGIQFHPESIGTEDGKQIFQNFIEMVSRKEITP